jgi:hypothetical protein
VQAVGGQNKKGKAREAGDIDFCNEDIINSMQVSLAQRNRIFETSSSKVRNRLLPGTQ